MDNKGFKRDFVDVALSYIAPRKALARMQSKMALEEYRKYDAAGRGRRTSSWEATGASVNSENAYGLVTVRNRSRDVVRNNPYANRAIKAVATNTIGAGIRPMPTSIDTESTANRFTEAWRSWAESTECDYDGQLTFYGIQKLAMRTIAESGEVLIRKRMDTSLAMPLQLQVLEPDFLDHTKDTPIRGFNRRGENYVIQGVEFDSKGKRVGYWMYDTHPGEGMVSTSSFVPASDVLHVYNKERPGQVRGVPFTASSIVSLYDFKEYEEAQLVRQKIAACFAVFIRDNDQSGPSSGKAKDKGLEKVSPGIIQRVSGSQDITIAQPPVLSNYNEYAVSVLRKIGIGIGVPYEVISGDLSEVNFTSGRMGYLEFHRLIGDWQTHMMVPMMCDPVKDWFVDILYIQGKTSNRKVVCRWMPPRREMIDPAKEVKGMELLVRNGFQAWSDIVVQMGGDPKTVFKQIVKDFQQFMGADIHLDCNPASDKGRKDSEDEDDEDEDDDLTAKQANKKKNQKNKK